MIKIDSSRHIKTGETKTSKYLVYPKFTLQSFGFDKIICAHLLRISFPACKVISV